MGIILLIFWIAILFLQFTAVVLQLYYLGIYWPLAL